MVPAGGPGTWWGETWMVEAEGRSPGLQVRPSPRTRRGQRRCWVEERIGGSASIPTCVRPCRTLRERLGAVGASLESLSRENRRDFLGGTVEVGEAWGGRGACVEGRG